MEEFKLKIFKEDKGTAFSEFSKFNLNDVKRCISELELFIPSISISLYQAILEKCQFVDFDDGEIMDLKIVFEKLNFYTETIFVLWDERTIDTFNIEKLILNWEYIFYPHSDEAVVLYDKLNNKILMFTDYGRVYYCHLRC